MDIIKKYDENNEAYKAEYEKIMHLDAKRPSKDKNIVTNMVNNRGEAIKKAVEMKLI